MRTPIRVVIAAFLGVPGLLLLAGCQTAPPPPPMILYPGEARAPSEICVVQIVRTQPNGGHATIEVREITRVGRDPEVFYSVRPGTAWSPPTHFMGPTPTQRSGPLKDPGTIPVQFEIVPGSYQIDFLYVPVPDRYGWTHRPSGENTTRLDCRAGRTYYLEGKIRDDRTGWVLAVTEEETGKGPLECSASFAPTPTSPGARSSSSSSCS